MQLTPEEQQAELEEDRELVHVLLRVNRIVSGARKNTQDQAFFDRNEKTAYQEVLRYLLAGPDDSDDEEDDDEEEDEPVQSSPTTQQPRPQATPSAYDLQRQG
ncbi:MAG: hypothetical protein H6502_04595 [Candidatus Woesearchaeota archaeon]|nr:MAG: hypothetical protein H6502_04595 [Candidatus Woesearchaeota archaeon]